MSDGALHVVTGAFGYSGKAIAERLLAEGRRVRTLTGSVDRENPFGGRVEVHPFRFDRPEDMVESLRGAAVLYNTYWVRFNAAGFRHSVALENTAKLFEAARQARVGRVVHVSITKPSKESPLEYFRGKARLEEILAGTGLSHAILRPAVLFGKGDVLINNIAWALRRFPFFAVFGDGQYKLQPIHVDDLARLAVEAGRDQEDRTVDAIGPETFAYRELVQSIGESIGKRRRIVSVSPATGLLLGKMMGLLVRDVVITREEIRGLMAGLLCTSSPPVGQIRLSVWARENASTLGVRYSSELARRRDRRTAYERL